jgi:hypothetical protein
MLVEFMAAVNGEAEKVETTKLTLTSTVLGVGSKLIAGSGL